MINPPNPASSLFKISDVFVLIVLSLSPLVSRRTSPARVVVSRELWSESSYRQDIDAVIAPMGNTRLANDDGKR